MLLQEGDVGCVVTRQQAMVGARKQLTGDCVDGWETVAVVIASLVRAYQASVHTP